MKRMREMLLGKNWIFCLEKDFLAYLVLDKIVLLETLGFGLKKDS